MDRATATEGLRLLVYDRTCLGSGVRPGLSHAWFAGSCLYRGLGRLDDCRGVADWREALGWLGAVGGDRPIAEVQYWGHGKWGSARAGDEVLDCESLRRASPLYPGLQRLRQRLDRGGGGLVWFRTCETLGARAGHRFAADLAEHLGCRVAGHTFIIGHWQSGLHSLRPGEAPHWPDHEGLAEGDPERPTRALWSTLRSPNTISCLHGAIPPGY